MGRLAIGNRVLIDSDDFSRYNLAGEITDVYAEGYRVRTNVGTATDNIHLSLSLYEHEVHLDPEGASE